MEAVKFTTLSLYPWETEPVLNEQEAGWSAELIWTFRRRERFLGPA
jgi:hypothetical protein